MSSLGFMLSLALMGHWTQISISCEWRVCAGRAITQVGLLPSSFPLKLRGLRSPGSDSTSLTCTQSSHGQQQSAGSAVMGAALPDHKDACIPNNVLMHEMSEEKQREHRQKGVS